MPADESVIQELWNVCTGTTTRRGGGGDLTAPRAATTTRERGMAAADLALALEHFGRVKGKLYKDIQTDLQHVLFPNGIEVGLLAVETEEMDEKSNEAVATSTIKPSTSAVSLSSLVFDNDSTTMISGASDSEARSPPAAREGALLILRAMAERRVAEPYVISGAFLAAALDECASSHAAVRQAAADTVVAVIQAVNPWSYRYILEPILLRSLQPTSNWRSKAAALESLGVAAKLAPKQVHLRIPTLVPQLTQQVWDTKAQVSKAAKTALLAVCEANTNPDIRSAIPAVVNAICKPSDTNKAVSELMGTTFVVAVDASTLAILCPILSRALKEKLAIHKRGACLVISNMAKLVSSPSSIAPFGHLLVPELQKVAANVQFEEIRDESLKALEQLTRALGEHTANSMAAAARREEARVQREQEQIQQERDAAAAAEAETKRLEEEERVRFQEAMDAQRRLDDIAKKEAAEKKAAEAQKREMQKLSTKGGTGKCQACGLKKCKKTCMFYSGK